MGLSETEICNQALGRIGQDRITVITEQSNNALVCRLFYSQTRDELLRQHPWNFAMASVQLAPGSDTPPFKYTYSCPLPADCLRVWFLYDSDEEWEVQGNNLLINSDEPQIEYIKKETDSGSFPADFIEVLVLKLATKLCAALTQNWKLAESLYKELELSLGRAKGADAQEHSYQELDTSTIINARY